MLNSLTSHFIFLLPNTLCLPSSNESIITLKGPDDWDAWEKQFKAEATRSSLLEHIEGSKTFLTAPMLPDPRNFNTQVQTRSSSVTPGSSAGGRPGTISISDLSADGRAHFQLALSFYKAEKAYTMASVRVGIRQSDG